MLAEFGPAVHDAMADGNRLRRAGLREGIVYARQGLGLRLEDVLFGEKRLPVPCLDVETAIRATDAVRVALENQALLFAWRKHAELQRGGAAVQHKDVTGVGHT